MTTYSISRFYLIAALGLFVLYGLFLKNAAMSLSFVCHAMHCPPQLRNIPQILDAVSVTAFVPFLQDVVGQDTLRNCSKATSIASSTSPSASSTSDSTLPGQPHAVSARSSYQSEIDASGR